MARVIDRSIKPDDKFFSTTVKITLEMLKRNCESLLISHNDLKEEGGHYVPGVMLIGLFRHVFQKLHTELPDFPFEKLDSFWGGPNGGTKERRLLIKSSVEVVYKLKYLCPSEKHHLYLVEICRKDDDNIVLQGIFSFLECKN